MGFYASIDSVLRRARAPLLGAPGGTSAQLGIQLQRIVMGMLAESSTAEAAMGRVLRAVCERLGWQRGTCWLVDDAGDLRRMRDWPARASGSNDPRDDEVLCTVLRSREPAWLATLLGAPNDGLPVDTSPGGVLAVPIGIGSITRGGLVFATSELRRPAHELVESLHALGGFLGQFIERTRAEDTSRRERHTLHAVIDNALDWVTIVRPDGAFLYNSPSLTNVLGFEPREVADHGFDHLVHDDDLPRVRRCLADVLRGITRFIEARCRHHDGSWRTLEIIGTRMDLPLEGTCILLNTRNVTTHKQAQQVLIQATEEALEATRLKSEFVDNVSHELRTPLHGIFGMLEMLRDTALDADQRDCTDTISRCAGTLLGLVDDLLDFSKIEAGRFVARPEPCEPRVVVEDVLATAAVPADARGLQLARHVADDVPRLISADGARLRQVLGNLVSNAVKFTVDGTIGVEVRVTGTTRKLLSFAVRDTGPGIPSKDLHLLFQPFAQIDGSMARRHAGTGLGLAIAKRLIEAMGGEVGVRSDVGRGSVFWFTLPLTVPAGV
jgi:PAS domain S-box-containing protein